MQIYLINSTIRKTTIDLNLYKHVKNPLLLILPFMTFTFSVVVKLLFCFSVNKFLIQCLQERLKWIITNIFVIGKFHFQISVWIRKAKFYFPITALWYVSVGKLTFLLVIWRISFFFAKRYSLKRCVLNLHMIFGGLGVDLFLSDDFFIRGESVHFVQLIVKVFFAYVWVRFNNSTNFFLCFFSTFGSLFP